MHNRAGVKIMRTINVLFGRVHLGLENLALIDLTAA
jgi:hypothetical protein